MDGNLLLTLAGRLAAREISADEFLREAAVQLGQPDYTTVDLERPERCGFPEVIFGEGKSAEIVVQIAAKLLANDQRVLATRIDADKAEDIRNELPEARYNAVSRTVRIDPDEKTGTSFKTAAEGGQAHFAPKTAQNEPDPGSLVGHVAVISAGTSDLPVAEEARETLDWMGVRVTMVHDVGVAGPHRLRERLAEFVATDAIVVVAGMEGALPSVVGGHVPCPVFAVPTSVGYGANLGGLAALLAMLNSCASNVAVVNIDAGFKAGYLAGLVATRRHC